MLSNFSKKWGFFMKKIVSIILTLAMMLSMFSSVSAATIAEETSYVPNPMELPLSVSVGAKISGSDDAFVYPPAENVSFTVGAYEKKGVDYSAKLDMATVRSLFDEGFIQVVLPDDAEARAEFDNGVVSTVVNVLIEYPATAIIDSDIDLTSKKVGTLDAGSIFSESAREVKENSVKITYVNTTGLKVSELKTNVETYLKDIEFTLKDVIAYSEAGDQIVKITLSGETLIDFASKDQKVIYSGSASNIVTVSKDGNIHNHELVVVPAVPATCLTDGTTEGIICRTHNSYGECGALGTKETAPIAKLNHMLNGKSMKIHVDAEAATCTSKGVLEHYTCALCKNDFDSADSDVVQSHEKYVTKTAPHTEETLAAVPATCITNGFEEGKQCKVCGYVTKAQKIIPALGHTETIIPAEKATCTEAGKTQGIECEECSTVIVKQEIVPAKGHNFGEWKVVVEATESTKGSMERTCTNEGCSEKETRDIEKKPHTCVADEKLVVITKQPTCDKEGLMQNYCVCGKKVGEEVSVPAKGHNVAAVAEVKATCVTEGIVAHYSCVVCDGKFRDKEATKPLTSVKAPVDKSNHGEGSIVKVPGIASTCAKQGLTDGAKCKNCGIITTPQTLLPLADHVLVTVPAETATCEGHGIKEHKHCKNCNKDFDMTGKIEWALRDFDVPALGHKYGDAVKYPETQEIIDGHYDGVKKCTNPGCTESIAVKIAVTPENCEHTVTFEVVDKKATCTEKGEKLIICLGCGKTDKFDLPVVSHTLVRTESVPSTCHSKGTAAFYTCSECGKMFDGTDPSVEITEVPQLDETTHVFREIGGGNNKQCIYCKEVIHVKKKDKDGNEDTSDKVTVNNKNVGVKEEKDVKKEEAYAEIEHDVKIEAEIIIAEREEASAKLDDAIVENAADVETEDKTLNKAVWDIEIEKVTTYDSGEIDREPVKEISDLIEIVIKIPDNLKEAVDFLVHRLHKDENGVEVAEIITTTPNDETGEYIIIDKNAGTVTLKVKKFSEYALVGYTVQVNEEESDRRGGGGGGGAAANYTITFKANGGTSVDSVKVAYGKVISAPVSTKEGFVLEGWYTDAEFTEKFDFSTAITKSMTLYAKWVEGTASGDCAGTIEAGCPAAKYEDVDTSLWYHAGIDYVLNKGLMIGVSDTSFAPNVSITRGMLVTVLGRKEGVKDDAIVDETFADVKNGEYYASHIDWAVKSGIVNGYGDGNFGPNDVITREQMAAIMFRYISFKNMELAGEMKDIAYADADNISDYAKEAVAFCYSKGIMTGKDGNNFDPSGKATRAEVATVMMRTFK